MPMRRNVVCCLCSLCLCAELVAGTARPGSGAAVEARSRPGGRWYYYPKYYHAQVTAANRGALWITCQDMLLRYDVKTQSTWRVGPLDGLPRGGLRGVLADDGRLVAAGKEWAYLWTPGKGFSVLPFPKGLRTYSFCWGRDGALWAFPSGPAYRWEAGIWQAKGYPPRCSRARALRDGWVLYCYEGLGAGRDHGTGYFDANWKLRTKYDPDFGESYSPRGLLAVGEKVYAKDCNQSGNPKRLWAKIHELTPEGYVERASGGAAGVDLAGNGFVTLTLLKSDGHTERWRIDTDKRPAPPPVEVPWSNCPQVYRDANGHAWVNTWRWDGKQWTRICPARCWPWQSMSQALNPDHVFLTPETLVWQPVRPRLPFDVIAYNPTTRCGWLRQPCSAFAKQRTFELVRFDAQGRRQVLHRIILGRDDGRPRFQDGRGDWWIAGVWCKTFLRWDGTDPHRYQTGVPGAFGCNLAKGRARLFLSPEGNVWGYFHDRSWRRYDPEADKFVLAEPFDEFAFRFGPWTLAVIGDHWQSFHDDPYSHVGRVFRKQRGRWRAMPLPIRDGLEINSPDFPVWGNRYMVRGDRMIVSCDLGTFEYDCRSGQWARLHHGDKYLAGFDSRGRRILVGYGECIYVFDGDPFTHPAAICKTLRDAHSSGGSDQEKEFERLLRLMDDSKWKVREQATEQMKALCLKVPMLLQRAVANSSLSLEVHCRLEGVLRGLDLKTRRRDSLTVLRKAMPASLLEQMHPQLTEASRPVRMRKADLSPWPKSGARGTQSSRKR